VDSKPGGKKKAHGLAKCMNIKPDAVSLDEDLNMHLD